MKNPDGIDEFDEKFAVLCEAWGKEPSALFATTYRRAMLSQLTFEDACSALDLPFQRKFYGFPQSGELIEIMRGGNEDKAVQAFEALYTAICRIGSWNSVTFQDPKITRAVELMGGWQEVCQWKTKETNDRRRDFMKIYLGLPDGGEVRALPGTHELNNRRKNFQDAIPAPAVIGEVARQIGKRESKRIEGGKSDGRKGRIVNGR